MNKEMGNVGFYHACITQYGNVLGDILFEKIHKVFDWLPLAALINNQILVVHGGIGDGSYTLSNICNDISRPIQDSSVSDMVHNLLWSDPSDSDEVMHR
jgi:diadenosine tetraphosphatase ApaH/serine/threonine PP2A family protein phosphatase